MKLIGVHNVLHSRILPCKSQAEICISCSEPRHKRLYPYPAYYRSGPYGHNSPNFPAELNGQAASHRHEPAVAVAFVAATLVAWTPQQPAMTRLTKLAQYR